MSDSTEQGYEGEYGNLTYGAIRVHGGSGIASGAEITIEGDASGDIESDGDLDGDVDNIVMKALRKEPHRRYASADLLAQDVFRNGLQTREIDAIQAAGRVPLLVGGTMMYFRSLTGGIAELPDADPAIRAAIDRDAEAIAAARRRFGRDVRFSAETASFTVFIAYSCKSGFGRLPGDLGRSLGPGSYAFVTPA